MKEQEKYNGWTNYATWRVNLDFGEVTHTIVQEMAEEFVLMDVDEQSMVASYAMAFMSEVNWHEIADHLNEEQKEIAQ